jgi:hypothetical protein
LNTPKKIFFADLLTILQVEIVLVIGDVLDSAGRRVKHPLSKLAGRFQEVWKFAPESLLGPSEF